MLDSATTVGIAGIGMYVPPDVITAEQLSGETGIPADVLFEKFGIRQVHRAGPDCHVSQMALAAAQVALLDAQVEPDEIDLVVYCGSEFKDYVVWSAATKITYLLGADRAEAFEVYALCAGTPVTLRIVRSMMLSDPALRTVLVVAASKESALVNRHNTRGRFMFNFGDGAGAAVLRRDLNRNVLLASASIVDGSLSEDVVMRAGGSRHPASAATLAAGDHYLDVPDLDHMRRRLDEVSGDNFLRVVHTALQAGGRERVNFLAPVHMKRSMYDWLRQALHADRAYYLEDYGHMQAADQFVALVQARQAGQLRDGDTVVLAAAGVGYTWAASVLSWGATP
ncbi:MAG TPA: 3-oxoacyl-ACP synthase [Chloroflexota bacterium]|jgi:3-oxoacyl-[acyl-carrier-protein] synthase-3